VLEVLKVIKQIGDTSSRTEKENILKQNSNNQLLKEILQFTYDPFIVTGLSSKKINKDTNLSPSTELNTIQEVMNYLKQNNTGRDIDIANVHHFIYRYDKELQEFFKKVVTKELKIGVTAKTLNKVYGKRFIKEFSVMLAKKFEDHIDKIKGNFVITEKLDGGRLVVVKESGTVKSFTRTGKQYEGLQEIESDIANLPLDNIVFDGELIADAQGSTHEVYAETMSKSRSKGTNKTGLVFHIFDMLPLDEFQNGQSRERCIARKQQLSKLFKDFSLHHCKEVKPLYIGNDLSQIDIWMEYANQQAWEGIMVNLDTPYVCKRSDCILKVKVFNDADVRVLNVLEGTGKNVGRLGAITIQFEHQGQLYECNCGSGFSDEERVTYWNNPELIIGKIVTVGYFEVSKNSDNTYGLRFPTWQGVIRYDKDEISMH
jgi:DNA ligase-1